MKQSISSAQSILFSCDYFPNRSPGRLPSIPPPLASIHAFTPISAVSNIIDEQGAAVARYLNFCNPAGPLLDAGLFLFEISQIVSRSMLRFYDLAFRAPVVMLNQCIHGFPHKVCPLRQWQRSGLSSVVHLGHALRGLLPGLGLTTWRPRY